MTTPSHGRDRPVREQLRALERDYAALSVKMERLCAHYGVAPVSEAEVDAALRAQDADPA